MEGESKSMDLGHMFQGTFFMTQEDRGHTQTGMYAGGVPLLLSLVFCSFFSSIGVKQQQQQQKYKKLIMIVIINNNNNNNNN